MCLVRGGYLALSDWFYIGSGSEGTKEMGKLTVIKS